MSVTFLCLFIGAALLSFFFTRAVRNIANGRGWVYAPPSSRHIHTELVPRMGGTGIFSSGYGVGRGIVGIKCMLGLSAGC